ncbi:hypothetical protein RF11_10472 [Thelohanellus kitauei]|uniref:Uncharacterized protein n=1 Tax=Thelohanellus kitauei TaxID=669202 RepID=A0A0C2IX93_THEKT|nr:hypothetical protein RF11_10472 [Thelohanellus kitauei]
MPPKFITLPRVQSSCVVSAYSLEVSSEFLHSNESLCSKNSNIINRFKPSHSLKYLKAKPNHDIAKRWYVAIMNSEVEEMKSVLTQDPGILSFKDPINSALHWACKNGSIAAVDFLSENGMDFNVTNVSTNFLIFSGLVYLITLKEKQTGLHVAFIHDKLDTAQHVIENQLIPLDLVDIHGRIASDYANSSRDFLKSDILNNNQPIQNFDDSQSPKSTKSLILHSSKRSIEGTALKRFKDIKSSLTRSLISFKAGPS